MIQYKCIHTPILNWAEQEQYGRKGPLKYTVMGISMKCGHWVINNKAYNILHKAIGVWWL